MTVVFKSAATLSFFGDDLDPDEISTALGSQPSVGVKKGGRWRTASGAEKIARTGWWRLRAKDCQPSDLDGQIKSLLGQLGEDFGAWRHCSERYRGRIFAGVFLAEGNEGLTLEPDTLQMLGARGLKVDFDIYGADVPD